MHPQNLATPSAMLAISFALLPNHIHTHEDLVIQHVLLFSIHEIISDIFFSIFVTSSNVSSDVSISDRFVYWDPPHDTMG
ncbi:15868_t:CDS:1, partial [Acaulospora colombiana]